MASRLGFISFFGVALAVACTCSSDSDLGSMSSPVHARVVWRKRTGVKLEGSGHYVVVPTGIETTHTALLVVDGWDERELREPTWSKGKKVELIGAPDAKRLAYRAEGAEWRVVYLQAAKEHVFLGAATQPAVDWATVPEFEAASTSLYGAASLNRQECVLEEVEKAAGARGVARLLTETVDVPAGDHWDGALAKLSAEAQLPVLAALEARLLAEGTGPALTRALTHLHIEQPKYSSALARLAKKLATSSLDKTPRPSDAQLGQAALALRAASATDAVVMAPLACELLALPQSSSELQRSALHVLVRAKAACASALALVERHACEPALTCLADPKLGRNCSEIDGSPGQRTFRDAPYASLDAALVAWAGAQAEVPAPIARWRERARYAIDQAAALACPAQSAGEPCRCDADLVKRSLCRVDGSRVETTACRFEVDDQTRRIVRTTSAFAGRFRELALSDYIGERRHVCGIDARGGLACFELPRDPKQAAKRPTAIDGVSAVRAVGASGSTVCALSDAVRCFELKSLDKPPVPEVVDLGGPVEDLAVAGLAVCGRRPGGGVFCSRGRGLPVDEIALTGGATRIGAGSTFLFAERPQKPGVWFICDGERCRSNEVSGSRMVVVSGGVAHSVTDRGEVTRHRLFPQEEAERRPIPGLTGVRSLAVDGRGGCAIDQAERLSCFLGDGSARPVLDRVRTVHLVSEVAAVLRTDGSIWSFDLDDPKPKAVF